MASRIYHQPYVAEVIQGSHGAAASRDSTLPVMQTDHARHLDRQADAELFAGHHAAAERLAWRAAELRGSGA